MFALRPYSHSPSASKPMCELGRDLNLDKGNPELLVPVATKLKQILFEENNIILGFKFFIKIFYTCQIEHIFKDRSTRRWA